MSAKDLVMVIDKPHVTVKLHKNLLEVDLKRGVKKKLENALEGKPMLRESLGYLFQTVVPIDVPLRSIESVRMNKKGQVKVGIPYRKDIVIPLKPKEAKSLVDKLNELVAIEKQKAEGADVVMVIEKPHFSVRLPKTLLEVEQFLSQAMERAHAVFNQQNVRKGYKEKARLNPLASMTKELQ